MVRFGFGLFHGQVVLGWLRGIGGLPMRLVTTACAIAAVVCVPIVGVALAQKSPFLESAAAPGIAQPSSPAAPIVVAQAAPAAKGGPAPAAAQPTPAAAPPAPAATSSCPGNPN